MEAIQEMPESRNTAFPKHINKERWGINNDKTNGTYVTPPTQKHRKTATEERLGTVSRKTIRGGWELAPVLLAPTTSLILMQLQITNIRSSTSSVKHHSETFILKNNVMKQSKGSGTPHTEE